MRLPRAAAPLPRRGPTARLARDLRRCLELADRDPTGFASAAAAWHARWCASSPTMTVAEAIDARNALDGLRGPGSAAAVRSLEDVLDRHGHGDLGRVVARWQARRGASAASSGGGSGRP